MTPQQIEQLEALYQAADKSKWVVDDPKHAHVQTDDYHSIDAGKGYHPEGFGIQSYMSLANAQLIAALHNAWPELKSALEAAQADARRYRWLREACTATDGEFFIGVDSPKHISAWALQGEEADAAIDAALNAGETNEP